MFNNDVTARPRVVVADSIDQRGLAPLAGRAELVYPNGQLTTGQALENLLEQADALLVRSDTQVTADLLAGAGRLKVIGRAGAGVDNIDVEAATRRGIVVVNAPGGNTFAAAEHTLALLLSAARRIAPADASIKQGEWRRSEFLGVEVRGKVLALIGLGRVGAEVARRAQAFDLRVLAYDPYVSADLARRVGVEVSDLRGALEQADFVSLHTPLTEHTRGLIGAEQLGWMKPTAFLINCARGGLVDEAALLAVLEAGWLAGAALDVFEQEPPADARLARHPKVVATPHLGASTVEAQVNVARQVAEQVVQVLEGKPAQFAVNAPTLPAEMVDLLEPYVGLAQLLGSLATQLADGQFRAVQVAVRGEVAAHDAGLLATAVLVGMLRPVSGEPVTFVNARLLARGRGLEVVEQHSGDAEAYTNLVSVEVLTDGGETRLAGTVVHGEPHIVGIDDYRIDLAPTEGYLLMTRHRDQPGMIGQVGTLLGKADVNISAMQVGRRERRGEALMILAVDEAVSQDVLADLRAVANMADVRVIKL
jgi:D-3-phosphoglycerate dehydrogenase / 2-oxoglutarate reductase